MDDSDTPRKVAVITGAGTGIGCSTALWLAKHHYNVAINYSKSKAEAEQCKAACEDAGIEAVTLQADVRDDSACKAMVEAVLTRWSRIDVLVNSAGATVFTGLENWDVLSSEIFHDLYAINALGPFQLARACASWLKQAGGCIVNVSSAAGVLGRGSSVPYLMSKGALNALTLYLARALAPEVRVNAVCPGLVTTRWFRDGLGEAGYGKLREKYEKQTPLSRSNTPEDVAEAIGWLIEGARTTTGELLMLDAGLHLG